MAAAWASPKLPDGDSEPVIREDRPPSRLVKPSPRMTGRATPSSPHGSVVMQDQRARHLVRPAGDHGPTGPSQEVAPATFARPGA